MRDFISQWTHGPPWKTWVAHAAIALLIAIPLSAPIALGYYFIREVEQVLYRVVNHEKLDPVDHVMDVLAPAIVCLPFILL